MTDTQIELARHALGLPNDRKTSYRNYFNTYETDPHWSEMVEQRDAVMRRSAILGGESVYFHLTYEGALKALKDDEKLDEEDVPAMKRTSARVLAAASPSR